MGSRVKAKVVLEGLQGKPETAICKRHNIKPAEYRRWRKEFSQGSPAVASRAAGPGKGMKVESAARCAGPDRVLPIPVFFKARDGKHLGATAWEAYFGVRRESFIGKTSRSCFRRRRKSRRSTARGRGAVGNPARGSYELGCPSATAGPPHAHY